VPNQDFFATDNAQQAYIAGANKWLTFGYSNAKMRSAMQRLLTDYDSVFPDTLKIVAPIAGTNGFVKINDDGTINTENPPNLCNDLIGYMKSFPNFAIMPTALFAEGGTPKNMCESGLNVWFQLNNDKLNKSTTAAEFEGALLNGKNHGAVAIEIYEQNIRQYPEIVAKYRT
jgi:hypothetical protein